MNRLGSMGSQITLWSLRLMLSGVFIYAGATKIRDPHAFSESVESFRLLPPVLVNVSALTLPPLEVLAGVCALLRGRLQRAGAFALVVMLVVFTVALASAQARGLTVDCGCFGADKFDVLAPKRNLWIAMARDVALGMAGWFLYAATRNPPPMMKHKAPTTLDAAGARG